MSQEETKQSDSRTPSYYVVIPASVRFDRNLSRGAILLYGDIVALCNQEGYCWASNKYFANMWDVSKSSIKNYLLELVNQKHIITEILDNNSRKIFINSPIKTQNNGDIPKQKNDRGGATSCPPPRPETWPPPARNLATPYLIVIIQRIIQIIDTHSFLVMLIKNVHPPQLKT